MTAASLLVLALSLPRPRDLAIAPEHVIIIIGEGEVP